MAPSYFSRGRGRGRQTDRRPARQAQQNTSTSNVRADGHISDSEFEKKVREQSTTLQLTYGHAKDSPAWREFIGVLYREHGRDIPWAKQEANSSDTSPLSVADSIQNGLRAFNWADDTEAQHAANGASATGDRSAPKDESTPAKENGEAMHTDTPAQAPQPAQPDRVSLTSQAPSTSPPPTFGGLYASRHADPDFTSASKEEKEDQAAADAAKDGGSKSTGPAKVTQAANGAAPKVFSSTPAMVGGFHASMHADSSVSFSSTKEKEAQKVATAEEQKDAQTAVQKKSAESSEPTPEEKAEKEWQEVELPKWRQFVELKRKETYEKYGATMPGSAAPAVTPTSAAPTPAPVQQGRGRGRGWGRGRGRGRGNGGGISN
ncbi:Hypothetical predicted protein [Lecanosticta acicola]|uniref:Uncharacterized protein n=1 Tax=Lecanosticta acicola TaxID=111012 RepID=A0AAI8YXG4_9PEZI|nr:Hypothetical predicted protein [Lecanosticta acicola]